MVVESRKKKEGKGNGKFMPQRDYDHKLQKPKQVMRKINMMGVNDSSSFEGGSGGRKEVELCSHKEWN